jgi:gluconolactonase
MRTKRTETLGALLLITVSVLTLNALGQQPAAGKVVRLDPALDKLVPPGAKIEKLLGNVRFAEGPVWVSSGGYLLFSDVMANATMKWSPTGGLAVYRKGIFSGTFPNEALVGSNGLTLDRQGRVVAAEHGNRRVVRIEKDAKDGAVTVLGDRYEGKRLNSPNDLVVKRNGDIYFTDPTGLYGRWPDGPGKPQPELSFNGVYRITTPGKVELLTKDIPYPNGIAFSPDESKLYVANSRPDKYWMQFDVNKDGALSNGRKFADVTAEPGEGVPDGMKVDTAGNIYATALEGVQVFSAQGKRLGAIQTPEIPANCAWGDADGKSLYITARTGLYRIKLNIAGIRP